MELSVYGAYTNGVGIWLPCENINVLFYQSLIESKGAKYLCSFEGGKTSSSWKIGNVIYFNDTIFFFSLYAYEVWILENDSLKMHKVSYYSGGNCFVPDIVKVDNEAWVMPRSINDPIIIFNLMTWQSEKVDLKKQSDIDDEYFLTKSCVNKGEIFFATRICGKIYICRIDCKSRNVQYEKIPNIKFVYCLATHGGTVYVLALDNNGNAFLKQYNLSDMSEECSADLKNFDPIWKNGHAFYSWMVICKNNVIIVPCLTERILIYELDKCKEINIFLPEKAIYRSKDKWETYFCKVSLLGKYLYLYPSYGKYLLILNLINMEFEIQEIFCQEEEFWSKYAEKVNSSKGIIEETVHISILEYIGYIKNEMKKNSRDIESSAGRSIYNIVCK